MSSVTNCFIYFYHVKFIHSCIPGSYNNTWCIVYAKIYFLNEWFMNSSRNLRDRVSEKFHIENSNTRSQPIWVNQFKKSQIREIWSLNEHCLYTYLTYFKVKYFTYYQRWPCCQFMTQIQSLFNIYLVIKFLFIKNEVDVYVHLYFPFTKNFIK